MLKLSTVLSYLNPMQFEQRCLAEQCKSTA